MVDDNLDGAGDHNKNPDDGTDSGHNQNADGDGDNDQGPTVDIDTKLEDFKKEISKQIHGAVTKAVSQIKTAQDTDPESSVLIDGVPHTVGDLTKYYKEQRVRDAERDARDKKLAIREGLQANGLIAENINIVTDALEGKVILKDGELTVENVPIPDPLHKDKTLTKDMKLAEYLKHFALQNPQLVASRIKPGTNSGGGGDTASKQTTKITDQTLVNLAKGQF